MATRQEIAAAEQRAARSKELEQERVTPHMAQTTDPGRSAHESGAAGPQAQTSRRHVLRTALGATTATMAAGAAGLTLERGTASANTGDNMILGQTNLANSGTQVKWNGSSGFTGVILLGNDTGFSDSGAFFPAAAGGWAGGGPAGVPHGVYGFTQVAPTSSLTPVGVAGVATLGTGVHGETRSASISSIGVEGVSPHGIGVSGTSTNGTGVSGAGGSSSPGVGVVGTGNTGVRATGVTGVSATGTGPGGVGVSAFASDLGVTATSSGPSGIGVQGIALGSGGRGVVGSSSSGAGVSGTGSTGVSATGTGASGVGVSASGPRFGVFGEGPNIGVFGSTTGAGGIGVSGGSTGGTGVQGSCSTGVGVQGVSSSGRGGNFSGGVAAIQLEPSTASTHPASGLPGDLFVDAEHNLWFCKGGSTWVKLA